MSNVTALRPKVAFVIVKEAPMRFNQSVDGYEPELPPRIGRGGGLPTN